MNIKKKSLQNFIVYRYEVLEKKILEFRILQKESYEHMNMSNFQ